MNDANKKELDKLDIGVATKRMIHGNWLSMETEYKTKIIIMMRAYGLTNEQIAKLMGLTESTVRNLYNAIPK